jgi:MerR family transcriptional regulator, light-induced transcriptional regulator
MQSSQTNSASVATPLRGSASTPVNGHTIQSQDVERFLQVLRGFDESAVDNFVAGALENGISADQLLVELVGGAAHEVGELWKQDRLNFVEVTLATGRLQRIVRALGCEIQAGPGVDGEARPVILLTAPVGQAHTLGLLMVAEFFQAASWTVCLGNPFDPTPAAEVAANRFLDVVGISLSLTDGTGTIRDEIRKIRRRSRNRSIAVLLGGPALHLEPNLARDVGADASCLDARLAPAAARALL